MVRSVRKKLSGGTCGAMPMNNGENRKRRGGDAMSNARGQYSNSLGQLSSRTKSGGGSDWMGTLYSAGAINSPPQSADMFKQFNTTTPYQAIADGSLTSPKIDQVLCGSKPVDGYDPYSDHYSSLSGGAAKKKTTKKKSAEKSAKKPAKKSVKKSHKKGGMFGSLMDVVFPTGFTSAAAAAGLVGTEKYASSRKSSTKKKSTKKGGAAKRKTPKKTPKKTTTKRNSCEGGGMLGALVDSVIPAGASTATSTLGLIAAQQYAQKRSTRTHKTKTHKKKSPRRF